MSRVTFRELDLMQDDLRQLAEANQGGASSMVVSGRR